MGRVARQSNRTVNGRSEWQVRLRERGLTAKLVQSRAYHHVEAERAHQDQWKDFDIVVPKRLQRQTTKIVGKQSQEVVERVQIPKLDRDQRSFQATAPKVPQATPWNVPFKSEANGANKHAQRSTKDASSNFHKQGGEDGRDDMQRDSTTGDRMLLQGYTKESTMVNEGAAQSTQRNPDDVSRPIQEQSILKFNAFTPLSAMTEEVSNVPTTVTTNRKAEPKESENTMGQSLLARTTYDSSVEKEVNTNLNVESFPIQDMWPETTEDLLRTDQVSELAADVDHEEPLTVETALEQGKLKDEIYVLGVGIVGKFIAHGLASLPHHPRITLLMQRALMIQKWHDEGASLTVSRQGRRENRTGFNIESASHVVRTSSSQRFAAFGPNMEHSAEPPSTPIDTLIVTTASKVTVPALMAVRDRLLPTSVICLIQDGLGVVEDLNTIVFPDPQRRPTYILGHLTGGQNLHQSNRDFTIDQKGDVKITFSKLPLISVTPATANSPSITRTDFSWSLPASFLMGALSRVPAFNASTVGHKTFISNQLHRVVAHAVIGPVSVMHDCTNGDLLTSHSARVTMQGVINEMSQIILALPELQSLPNIEKNFSPKRLESVVRSTLVRNAKGMSTMLRNVRDGKRTDIDYYNGWLLIRAAEMGMECPRNEMLVNVVKAKQMIKSKELERVIPFT